MSLEPANDAKYLSLSETDVLGQFHCQMCQVKLFHFRAFEAHLRGRKHKINVNKLVSNGKIRHLKDRKIRTISTGRPALLQRQIDSTTDEPIIGLQHLIEYVGDINIQREPVYVCSVCDTKLDGRNVMDHMVGLRHRMSFMRRFYPKIHLDITDKYREDSSKRMRLLLTRDQASLIELKEGRQPVIQRRHLIDNNNGDGADAQEKEFLQSDCIALGESHELYFSVSEAVGGGSAEPLVPLSSLLSSWFVLPPQPTSVPKAIQPATPIPPPPVQITSPSLEDFVNYVANCPIANDTEAQLYRNAAERLKKSLREYRGERSVSPGTIVSPMPIVADLKKEPSIPTESPSFLPQLSRRRRPLLGVAPNQPLPPHNCAFPPPNCPLPLRF